MDALSGKKTREKGRGGNVRRESERREDEKESSLERERERRREDGVAEGDFQCSCMYNE